MKRYLGTRTKSTLNAIPRQSTASHIINKTVTSKQVSIHKKDLGEERTYIKKYLFVIIHQRHQKDDTCEQEDSVQAM
jgi:hypothetical protein